jgi:hypothetical protein
MQMKYPVFGWLLIGLLVGSVIIGNLPRVIEAQTTGTLSENVAEYGLEILVCSYFGGSQLEWGTKLDFDSVGNLVVTGMTWSPDLTLVNAEQSDYAGLGDGFVLKMTTEGEIIFSTLFGGNGQDNAMAVLVDDDDNIIIAGDTDSTNLTLVNQWSEVLHLFH